MKYTRFIQVVVKSEFACLVLLVLCGCGRDPGGVRPTLGDATTNAPAQTPAATSPLHPQVPVQTIDLAELPHRNEVEREAWIESMRSLDGKVVRAIGCFSFAHSAVDGDPASLSLFAPTYLRYANGNLLAILADPPRRWDVRFNGRLPDMATSEEAQPFAVTGVMRLDDPARSPEWDSWARLEAISYEPIHSIPVGPWETIQKEDVIRIEELSGEAWSDFVADAGSGAKGRRNVGQVRPRNQTLIVRHRDTQSEIVKVFRIRPGGYYLTRAEDILIVPDPTGRE